MWLRPERYSKKPSCAQLGGRHWLSVSVLSRSPWVSRVDVSLRNASVFTCGSGQIWITKGGLVRRGVAGSLLCSDQAEAAGAGAEWVGQCGKQTRNRVPLPTALLTLIWPPCLATMLYEIERPSPVPCPTGLVVKKGSNILARCSGAIPLPVSSISIQRYC